MKGQHRIPAGTKRARQLQAAHATVDAFARFLHTGAVQLSKENQEYNNKLSEREQWNKRVEEKRFLRKERKQKSR